MSLGLGPTFLAATLAFQADKLDPELGNPDARAQDFNAAAEVISLAESNGFSASFEIGDLTDSLAQDGLTLSFNNAHDDVGFAAEINPEPVTQSFTFKPEGLG